MSIILKAWKSVDGEVVYIQESESGEGILGANYVRIPGLDRVVANDLSSSEDFANDATTQAALDLKYDASNPNNYETPTQLNSRDVVNRSRTNHTGTQTANTISDFQSTVSSNATVTTNVSDIAQEIIDRTNADSTLQTQIDSNDVEILELTTNQGDLITLSGVSENSEDLGSFTGSKLDANQNVKEALQDLSDELEIHEQTIDNHGDVDVTTIAPVNTNILRFDGNNWIPSRERQFTQLSGRFEIDSDGDWACWSDPSFGPSLQDWDLDLGNGTTPNIDWDGMGLLFPQAATLKKMMVKVRGDTADIETIEVFARAHDVNLQADLPIDSNTEIGAVDITPTGVPVDLNAGAAEANDVRGFEISLNDYTFNNDGDLHVMMRGELGSLSGNRQLRCTIYIEWEMPL